MIRVKVSNPAMVGLILLDSSFKPVYCNSEALRILAYPNQPPKAPGARFSESMDSIIGAKPDSSSYPMTTHFMSGKRRYLCRTFVLENEFNTNSKPAIAITLERRHSVIIDLAARFQLTDREIEAVQHLADGLTSKEIAQRMNISPNTVKVFLRLVMLKMGVTTRSGVIGKLMSDAHLGYEWTNGDTMH
jgi:DNA-binding CsgD family transcriptional regulator